MKSKTSFFDPALLKKNISRFAPAWGIFLVMLLLAFPVSAMREVSEFWDAHYYLESMASSGVIISFLSAILFASMLFRYLHNTRAAYMVHAFPMTRTCLFVTNLISGLLFFLVPVLVTALANRIVFLASGVSIFELEWIARWCLDYLFFYGLAVFCMFLSGSQFISVLSYAALNFVFFLIPVAFLSLANWFVYGLSHTIPDWLMYLSPILVMDYDWNGIGPLAIYAGLGLVLMGLGWLLYQKRHVERAGDAMVFPWAAQLFRLVFTFCVGIYLGMGFASLHAEYFLPLTLIGLFIGWFSATMILRRTAKVFKDKKTWMGYGLFALALLLAIGAMRYDVLGWQRRIPDAAEIRSVKIWTCDDHERGYTNDALRSDLVTLTEPDQIESVRQLHSSFLEKREAYVGVMKGLYYDGLSSGFNVEYQLADGTTLYRCYDEIPEECMEQIERIYSDGRIAGPWYETRLPKKISMAELRVQSMYKDESYVCLDGQALRAALVADAAAGRLSAGCCRYWFSNNYEEDTMYLILYAGGNETSIMIPATATETLKLFELPQE